ncbi:hypothetical protein HY68_01570 [Streptomyces sp. AcH 505]|nr:hypothetical protein HY68_01570 [Streptomyces sp. AcH 505]
MGLTTLMHTGRPHMPTPTPCLGPCNTTWRRAERALTQHGTAHDVPVTWGDPVHCRSCVDRADRHLSELPELFAAITLEALYGSRSPATSSLHSAPTDTTPWPGQSARLLLDLIVGGMVELRDETLRLRGLRAPDAAVDTEREGPRITHTVHVLRSHLPWILADHPLAQESHEALREPGRAPVQSGNPAATIAHWHRMALRYTARDEQRLVERLAPCKRCLGPWLAESRDLRLVDDRPFIECQDPDCRALLTQVEYDAWVKELTQRAGEKADATPGETAA